MGGRFACIVGGPTAVGKTAVGVELARRWGAEIISADSMQVYRRLSVGTAKPKPNETAGVPYHLIDCLGPSERFSAAEFLRRATPILDRLLASSRRPVVVGGTGLYIEALMDGLFEQAPIAPEIRRRIEDEIASMGPPAAHERLAQVDPQAASRIHPNDRVRIVRALEVYEALGKTITQLREEGKRKARRYRSVLFVLNMPRQRLYERIDRRVERMFDEGLIEETDALLSRGYSTGLPWMRALGYSHVAEYLSWAEEAGSCPSPSAGIAARRRLKETIEAVKQAHRNYAKRQLTWFRKCKGARWIATAGLSPEEIADRLEKNLETPGADAG